MIPQFHFAPEEVQAHVSKVFGAGYLVAGIARMHGGAQKAVYKVECQNGFSCVLYVWDLSQNYFQEEILNESGAHRSYGSDLFALNNRYLRQHGISTPRLYDLNNDRDRIPFDFALVEYVQGQKAEAYFQLKDANARDALFRRVRDLIGAMHAMERDRYGKADHNGGDEQPCFEARREHAESALTYAAGHLANVRENDSGLLDKLHGLASEIQPRSQYRFIHGELGPDHILVDDQMQPFLIDIEGAEFYDLEHEHSFCSFGSAISTAF
ncbi:phosphotransferase family protein [Cohnella hashimotonis]|uniref:phosphotransferase family protein n=1 Tax=Cohnella hashimotonis TaxID=2826895 RepID=UPI0033130ABB